MRMTMGSVHADVLKMARTEEKRARIRWYHARRVFFDLRHFGDGLALARQSEHQDALFLVSLFPDRPPVTKEEAAATFLARSHDPRCLCWAAECGAKGRDKLLEAAAEAGYAFAQVLFGSSLPQAQFDRKRMWMERAAAQGERDAIAIIADWMWTGSHGVVGDKEQRVQLWRTAAELGHRGAQFRYAAGGCAKNSLEHFVWLRRSAIQLCERNAKLMLFRAVVRQMQLYDDGSSGRIVFELGAAFSAIQDWTRVDLKSEQTEAAERAVALYIQWCAEAKRAVMCWMWMARGLGVAKDIRLLIADLIWDEKTAWSERTENLIAM